MTQTQLVKARLIVLDGTDKDKQLVCLFNPKSFSLSKSGQWGTADAGGGNVPRPQVFSGQPAELRLNLLFDTYADSDGPERTPDVRVKYTNALWRLLMTDPKFERQKSRRSRPPTVQFQWGNSRSFPGVITNIKQDFTMFTANGTPVRAEVELTIREYQDTNQLPMQNPTSAGDGGERYWQVREGDTLALIAYQQLGDQRRWRDIADLNRLTQVRQLPVGKWLMMPHD